jgi:hypothetical protein
MAVEGALFFPDLVQADPTNLLPIASAFSWLMNVESGTHNPSLSNGLPVSSAL